APAVVVDDLSGVLDDATFNGDQAASRDGNLAYAAGQLAWVGALPSGGTVTVSYSVTVTGTGDLDMTNVAFVPPASDEGCDGSGTCPMPDPDECVDGVSTVTGQPCDSTETLLPALYVGKQVDRTSAGPDDVLTFTVAMTNTGGVDFTDADPAVLTDDLAGALD